MTAVRILGIGSPFGADTLGMMAAAKLRASGLSNDYPAGMVSIDICDRPGVGLLDELRGIDLAILIDAARFGAHTGQIRRFGDQDIEDAVTVTSSHNLGVAEALALGRSLNTLPPVILYGIEIGPEGHAGATAEIAPEDMAWLKTAIQSDIATHRGTDRL